MEKSKTPVRDMLEASDPNGPTAKRLDAALRFVKQCEARKAGSAIEDECQHSANLAKTIVLTKDQDCPPTDDMPDHK